MDKEKVITVALIVVVGVLLGWGWYAVTNRTPKDLGRVFTSTVTNTSITINTTTTEVVAAGENLQRLIIRNLGTGTGYCAFGTVATSGTGMVINTAVSSTSTQVERDITDPNLLKKTMNCLSTVQGSFSILKY